MRLVGLGFLQPADRPTAITNHLQRGRLKAAKAEWSVSRPTDGHDSGQPLSKRCVLTPPRGFVVPVPGGWSRRGSSCCGRCRTSRPSKSATTTATAGDGVAAGTGDANGLQLHFIYDVESVLRL